MNKILIINKPKNYTSRDIVNIISKKFNTKKVGHFGTLDPLASGVLTIGVGCYTKLCNCDIFNEKEYVVEVKLGIATDTYDITGNVLKQSSYTIDKQLLIDALKGFEKTYLQEVPIYSAVKVNGKKLYEYARNNEQVTLPKKEVTIYNIEFISLENDLLTFKTLVSKGTYIRSLINDLSISLNIPMTMNNLTRTKQGPFNIEKSNTLEDVENNNIKYIDISEFLDLTIKPITNENAKQVLNGAPILQKSSDKKYILYRKNDQDVVLYQKEDNSNTSKVYFYYS